MAILCVLPTFQDASEEARRLAAKFDCIVGLQRSSDGWVVHGPVDQTDSHQWRQPLELAEWTERTSQLASTYADYEEYEYDGLQLRSDGSDPRWSEHDNLKNESY